MPALDPPAKSHHLRVTTDLSGVLTWLQDVSGSVIGLHPTSSKEKPHYHIWLESDRERTAQTIRNQMKQRKLEVFGNGSYSIRVHTEYDNWYNYVFCPCKGAIEVLYNTSHSKIEKPNCGKCRTANTLVYAVDTGAPVAETQKAPKARKKPMRVLFHEHCKSIGWVENEHFTSEKYDNTHRILKEASDECTDFWKNAFYVTEGERMVRNAIYEFGDENVKRICREKNEALFFNRIFG